MPKILSIRLNEVFEKRIEEIEKNLRETYPILYGQTPLTAAAVIRLAITQMHLDTTIEKAKYVMKEMQEPAKKGKK